MTVFPLCSLIENYAIRRLQEQFITQVAAQVLFEEGVKYMEQEMDEIGGMEASTSKSTIFIIYPQTNKNGSRTLRGSYDCDVRGDNVRNV